MERAEKEIKVLAIRGNKFSLPKLLGIISAFYSRKVGSDSPRFKLIAALSVSFRRSVKMKLMTGSKTQDNLLVVFISIESLCCSWIDLIIHVLINDMVFATAVLICI